MKGQGRWAEFYPAANEQSDQIDVIIWVNRPTPSGSDRHMIDGFMGNVTEAYALTAIRTIIPIYRGDTLIRDVVEEAQ